MRRTALHEMKRPHWLSRLCLDAVYVGPSKLPLLIVRWWIMSVVGRPLWQCSAEKIHLWRSRPIVMPCRVFTTCSHEYKYCTTYDRARYLGLFQDVVCPPDYFMWRRP